MSFGLLRGDKMSQKKAHREIVRLTSKDIIHDHKSLPVDTSDVEWVFAEEYDSLKAQADALAVALKASIDGLLSNPNANHRCSNQELYPVEQCFVCMVGELQDKAADRAKSVLSQYEAWKGESGE